MININDVKGFLSYLAVDKNVSASSQNLAFNALLFFFRHVLGKEFGKLDGVVRAKRRPYIPVVLSKEEVNMQVQHSQIIRIKKNKSWVTLSTRIH
jgi:hypothetical protein